MTFTTSFFDVDIDHGDKISIEHTSYHTSPMFIGDACEEPLQFQALSKSCSTLLSSSPHKMHSSARTLPTALNSSYSTINNGDDDRSISESSWMGDFNSVDFEMDLEDDEEEPLPTTPDGRIDRAHQLLTIAAEALQHAPLCEATDMHEPLSFRKEEHFDTHTRFIHVTEQQLRELPMDDDSKDSYSSDHNYGISTAALHDGQQQQEDYDADFSGNCSVRSIDSTRSLQQAFEDLNACMERTARSRELVKQLTAASVSAPSPGSVDQRRMSVSVSCDKMEAPLSPMTPSSPKKVKVLTKARSQQSRREQRARKEFSRTTGVRPVNWSLLTMDTC